MGVWEQFPYTNMQNANLDWVLENLDKLITDWYSTKSEIYKRVDELEKAVSDFKDFVNNFFDNLDVQDQINKKIDEMVESGEFMTIMSTNTNIYYNIVHTFNESYNRPYYLQGGCFLEGDKYVTAFVKENNLPAKIEILNMKTGEVLQNTEHVIGHANGCCFNPDANEILFLDGAKNDVFIFDAETLNFKKAVTLVTTEPLNGIGFLKRNPLNKPLFVFSSWKHIYYFDTDFVQINVYEIPSGTMWTREPNLQTMSVIGDTMCLLSAFTNRIYLFKYPCKYYKTLAINPRGAALNAYEIESFSGPDLNNVYFAAYCFPTTPPTPFFAKTSLTGSVGMDNNTGYAYLKDNGIVKLFVDEKSISPERNGSKELPFASVSEAQSFLTANGIISAHISLQSDITHSIYILTPCMLLGNNHRVSGGIVVSSGGTVEIRGLHIDGYTNYPGISDNNFSIGVNCPDCFINDVVPETSEDVVKLFISGSTKAVLYLTQIASSEKFDNVICYGSCTTSGYIPTVNVTNNIIGLKNFRSKQSLVINPKSPVKFPYISIGESNIFFTFTVKTSNTEVANVSFTQCSNKSQTEFYKINSINGIVSFNITVGDGNITLTLNDDNEAPDVSLVLFEIRK